MDEVECIELVLHFFDGNIAKTKLWFETPNPGLGNIAPETMIRMGRVKKLRTFIDNLLAGNRP